MKACEQAKGLSVYQHGIDVANRYRDIYQALHGAPSMYKWAIPDDSFELLSEIAKQALTPKEARTYQVLHDCGKPFCLEIDELGRRHFPDHARISAELYGRLFPDDPQTLGLISKDMLCHTLRGEAADEFARDPQAPTLIITAWAELHANAEALFGGFTSDSFKIKRKALEKITRKIHKVLQEPQLEV